MKIIFHIGEYINANTIVKSGILDGDTQQLYIEYKDKKYLLNDIQSVNFYKFNGLGTMVKIKNNNDTIFLSVPRIFIDKGTGFAIINFFKTKKAKQILELAMEHQKLNKR